MFQFQKCFVLSFVLLSLSACSQNSNFLQRLSGDEGIGIFSNRPIHQDQFTAVLKLQSPPLLTSVQQVEGQSQVDPQLAKQIELEQTQAIAELKALSPEIQILFRYKMVLNALAIVAPASVREKLKATMHIAYMEAEGSFGRPVVAESDLLNLSQAVSNLKERNSVKFIGAESAHATGIQGQGIKVGVLDTGIDYTHSMLGGSGSADDYKAIDPSKANSAFPNKKVVGGIDLAGTDYNTSSGDFQKRIPKPDINPLDEAGHGTHVAGTIAGVGDREQTYSGVAPEAELYAIKVFGANGSTGDAVVIAGLEYAADPNADGLLNDQLDVVNLSLGSNFGTPRLLYGEAIRNLSNGGTVVVASAGNSGDQDYIVGAPSIVDEAISVAASVDNTDHNWKFDAIKFSSSSAVHLTEVVEGTIGRPIAQAGPVTGALVEAGLAATDFSPELAAALKGKVALIDRGAVNFADKVRRATLAGAIGVVVANNQPGAPIPMGGEGKYGIPAVMIPQDLGIKLKAEMKTVTVTVFFQTEERFEKTELIDTLTGFSSKGPRSLDGLLKPEITAPGANIISAAMGEGDKGVKMSGTSMSGPHIAGVMALLRQARPDLSPAELKSILMGQAKSITDATGKTYLLSRQGAGRVQVMESIKAALLSSRTSLSLGEVNIEAEKVFRESFELKNISKSEVNLRMVLETADGMTLENPQDFKLAAGESKTVAARIRLKTPMQKDSHPEMDGLLKFMEGDLEIHRIPVLAVLKKISRVQAQSLKVAATSEASSAGSAVEMKLVNPGVHEGRVYPFNFIGSDSRKKDLRNDPFMSRACDLQAVGYRIVDKEVDGAKLQVLQIGVKTYDAMTTWNLCEASVLIDSNGDQVAEQELSAIQLGNVSGLASPTNADQYASVLLDAGKAREIRATYELESAKPEGSGAVPFENYAPATLDALTFDPMNRSTVLILEADVSKLAKRSQGQLAIKVATTFNGPYAVESDDFMGNSPRKWTQISLQADSQSFKNLPEVLTLGPGQSLNVEFNKGQGTGKLLLLFPENRTVQSDLEKDSQLQLLKPTFGH